MDKNLEKIIELSDKMLSFRTQQLYIKEKFEAETVVGHSGGIFKLDQSLISYIKTIIDLGKKDNIVVLDMNQTPVLIQDLTLFLSDIVDKYLSALGRYYFETQELKKSKPGSWRITRKA